MTDFAVIAYKAKICHLLSMILIFNHEMEYIIIFQVTFVSSKSGKGWQIMLKSLYRAKICYLLSMISILINKMVKI